MDPMGKDYKGSGPSRPTSLDLSTAADVVSKKSVAFAIVEGKRERAVSKQDSVYPDYLIVDAIKNTYKYNREKKTAERRFGQMKLDHFRLKEDFLKLTMADVEQLVPFDRCIDKKKAVNTIVQVDAYTDIRHGFCSATSKPDRNGKFTSNVLFDLTTIFYNEAGRPVLTCYQKRIKLKFWHPKWFGFKYAYHFDRPVFDGYSSNLPAYMQYCVQMKVGETIGQALARAKSLGGSIPSAIPAPATPSAATPTTKSTRSASASTPTTKSTRSASASTPTTKSTRSASASTPTTKSTQSASAATPATKAQSKSRGSKTPANVSSSTFSNAISPRTGGVRTPSAAVHKPLVATSSHLASPTGGKNGQQSSKSKTKDQIKKEKAKALEKQNDDALDKAFSERMKQIGEGTAQLVVTPPTLESSTGGKQGQQANRRKRMAQLRNEKAQAHTQALEKLEEAQMDWLIEERIIANRRSCLEDKIKLVRDEMFELKTYLFKKVLPIFNEVELNATETGAEIEGFKLCSALAILWGKCYEIIQVIEEGLHQCRQPRQLAEVDSLLCLNEIRCAELRAFVELVLSSIRTAMISHAELNTVIGKILDLAFVMVVNLTHIIGYNVTLMKSEYMHYTDRRTPSTSGEIFDSCIDVIEKVVDKSYVLINEFEEVVAQCEDFIATTSSTRRDVYRDLQKLENQLESRCGDIEEEYNSQAILYHRSLAEEVRHIKYIFEKEVDICKLYAEIKSDVTSGCTLPPADREEDLHEATKIRTFTAIKEVIIMYASHFEAKHQFYLARIVESERMIAVHEAKVKDLET